MYRYYITITLFLLCNIAKAQVGHWYNTDWEFNNTTFGVVLNRMFIKSDIGINVDSCNLELFSQKSITSDSMVNEFKPFWIKCIGEHNDSLYIDQEPSKENPIIINETPYTRLISYITDDDVQLITLEDIKDLYYPNIKKPCLYMINKYFIMRDADSYKLDKTFIQSVELVNSTDIEFFQGNLDFAIIRIFTNIPQNRHTGRIQ